MLILLREAVKSDAAAVAEEKGVGGADPVDPPSGVWKVDGGDPVSIAYESMGGGGELWDGRRWMSALLFVHGQRRRLRRR